MSAVSSPAKKQQSLLRHAVVPVWALLMVVTIVSWRLGAGHGGASVDHRIVLAVILVLAFAKVYLVADFFMELRHAPSGLRAIFYGWILLTCTVLVSLCLK